jgi:hypothetical protein
MVDASFAALIAGPPRGRSGAAAELPAFSCDHQNQRYDLVFFQQSTQIDATKAQVVSFASSRSMVESHCPSWRQRGPLGTGNFRAVSRVGTTPDKFQQTVTMCGRPAARSPTSSQPCHKWVRIGKIPGGRLEPTFTGSYCFESHCETTECTSSPTGNQVLAGRDPVGRLRSGGPAVQLTAVVQDPFEVGHDRDRAAVGTA